MHKRHSFTTILVIICSLLVFSIVAGEAYYFGLQNQKSEVESLKAENVALRKSATKTTEALNSKLNRAINDYDSACAEYQKLHTAYDQLYQKSGKASGFPRYLSPDAARGNEESCYR